MPKEAKLEQERNRIYKKWFNRRIGLANTTNFTGRFGQIVEIDFHSKEPGAMFGYHIKTKLDSGVVVTSYKFDGLEITGSKK